MVGLMVWIAWMAVLEPPSDACRVDVVGMPVSGLTHHRLSIDGAREQPLLASNSLHVDGDPVRLRILGPRYEGALTVTAERCTPGAVLELEAHPRPARISFGCAPPRTTVVCLDCPELGDEVYLPDELPPIPMDEPTREVELLIRSPGFKRLVLPVLLHPGANQVRLQLEPL